MHIFLKLTLSASVTRALILALIIVGAVNTASAQTAQSASSSKYYPYYQGYQPNASSPPPFWRNVTKMNNTDVPNGLGIWNTSGTYGPGIVSESLSYAMINAALYNDQATFNKLSVTVQAGIPASGKGLFPWYWVPASSGATTSFVLGGSDTNSASDADINLALAYIYADQAKTVYGWVDPTSGPTYKTMASSYIAAIRSFDFSSTDTNDANNYILSDGWKQAASLFSSNNWHPDYSDIRAYQLFQLYDTGNTAFWQNAISYTQSAWQAVFYFGANDNTGRTLNTATGPINSSKYYTDLSQPTYQQLEGSSDYAKITAVRGGSTPSSYNADACRLPLRLENYINATDNATSSDLINMRGIAGANFGALGTSFVGTGYNYLTDTISINYPWYQQGSGWIQNFQSVGLLAYALDPNLASYNSNASTIASTLTSKWGNGATTNGIGNGLTDTDGFNASLSLWGLTVPNQGETPLQAYMRQLNTNLATASGTTLTYSYDALGQPTNSTSPQAQLTATQTKTISSATLPLAVKSVSLNIALEVHPSRRGLTPTAVSIKRPGGVPVMVYSSQSLAPDSQGQVNLGVLQVPNNAGLPWGTSPSGTWTVSVQSISGRSVKIKKAILNFNK